ncbi:MAG: hypothetical protein N3F07_01835 [Candidatus Micrarchaeota archaeon]|nr:hypothetical protein [Candidatus Micrarchaeota archaeon]
MGWLDILGGIAKRGRLEANSMRGRAAEEIGMMKSTMRGNEVKRSGRGSDWMERKVDDFTGRKGPWRHVECKTGAARLSQLQRETKRKARRYRVERYWF